LKLPEGTNLQRTQNTIKEIEGTIKELLGNKIRMIYSQAGGDINTTTAQSQLPQMRTLQILNYS